MQVIEGIPCSSSSLIVILGFFDGIHKGHTQLFKQALSFKKKNPHFSIALCTFKQTPISSIKNISLPSLFTLEERLSIFESLGVEQVFFLPPTKEFFNLSAQEFLAQLLLSNKEIHFITGEDARFGQDQQGGKVFLETHSSKLGDLFSFSCLPLFYNPLDGEKLSSTPLRETFKAGKIKELNALLDFPMFFTGKVIHGDKQGRLIGFPTLNIPYPEGKIIPPFGVYESQVTIKETIYKSLTYISNFRLDKFSDTPLSETWVQNFNAEIYGESLKITLLNLQRPPIKINNLEDLKTLLEKDKQTLETNHHKKD